MDLSIKVKWEDEHRRVISIKGTVHQLSKFAFLFDRCIDIYETSYGKDLKQPLYKLD